jgi:hypothetical protein
MICKRNSFAHWCARSTHTKAKSANRHSRSRYDAENKRRNPNRRKTRTAEDQDMEAKDENGLCNLQVSNIVSLNQTA